MRRRLRGIRKRREEGRKEEKKKGTNHHVIVPRLWRTGGRVIPWCDTMHGTSKDAVCVSWVLGWALLGESHVVCYAAHTHTSAF